MENRLEEVSRREALLPWRDCNLDTLCKEEEDERKRTEPLALTKNHPIQLKS